jgi:hypothetical protein
VTAQQCVTPYWIKISELQVIEMSHNKLYLLLQGKTTYLLVIITSDRPIAYFSYK